MLNTDILPQNNSYKADLGVIMRLDYGDAGCGPAYGGVARNRDTYPLQLRRVTDVAVF
jgi:hypothetical protein